MVFSVSSVKLINLLLISVGIGICLMCFLQSSLSKHLQNEPRRYFQTYFVLLFLYIGTHLARELLEGHLGTGVNVWLHIVTFLEMLAAGVMAYLMSMAILRMVAKPEKGTKILARALLGMLCLHGLMLLADQFFGRIYRFDALNYYRRGPLYLLCNLCPLGMMMIDATLLIRVRKTVDPKIASAFWVYLIAPLVGIAVQSISNRLQLIIFATIGAAAYLFTVLLRDLSGKYRVQQKENARIETELDMASQIQSDMLPNIYPAFPDRPEFDIFASMSPARELGGDFYDFFLADEDHLCMIMADVSGKGVPAALFMMAAKIVLASCAKRNRSPAQILSEANAAIAANNRESMFITIWLGMLEISTGKLVASNAGHEYPVFQQPGGSFTLYKDQHSFVVGGMETAKYKEYSLDFVPGTKLFLYTDGIPEATREDQTQFGTERMLEALNRDPKAAPEQIVKNVHQAVGAFVGKTEQFDDMTVLCLEYMGPQGT